MKLKEVLQVLKNTQEKYKISTAYITGGTPRDRYMKRIDNVADIDITTGDKTVDYLSYEFFNELKKNYNVTRKSMDDGHSSVYLGNLKIDFSSNFNATNITQILQKQGIQNPTELQKEMFSRDFTCNALLLTLDFKYLVDSTKHGLTDIDNKIIKTCLSPEITFNNNKRIARAVYLACKLDFNVDQNIIDFVSKNPQLMTSDFAKTVKEKLDSAFTKNPEKASKLITQMNLWNYIPITKIIYPYYMENK